MPKIGVRRPLEDTTMDNKLAVLAFSGGLDTSFCVPWLQEQGYDVVTVTVDTGGVISAVTTN